MDYVSDLMPFMMNYLGTMPQVILAIPELIGILPGAFSDLMEGLPHVLNVFGFGEFLPPGLLE